MLFEGRCNTEVFHQCLEQMLLPERTQQDRPSSWTTRYFMPLSARKSGWSKSGCVLLFLALYWPDLKPIENLWANLKRRWRECGGSLDGFIRESGYISN